LKKMSAVQSALEEHERWMREALQRPGKSAITGWLTRLFIQPLSRARCVPAP
jgi:hypothetical protein